MFFSPSDIFKGLTINPFVPNAPSLYPLKTLLFYVFREWGKGTLGMNGLIPAEFSRFSEWVFVVFKGILYWKRKMFTSLYSWLYVETLSIAMGGAVLTTNLVFTKEKLFSCVRYFDFLWLFKRVLILIKCDLEYMQYLPIHLFEKGIISK